MLRVVITVFTLISASTVAIAEGQIRWMKDLDSARQASAQFQVPLMIHFVGDHCVPCQTLEQRVYSQQRLIDTLNKYFICVKINASQNVATAAEFHVHSWPTDIFLSPDGKRLHQGVCPQDLNTYMSTLHNVALMNRDRNVMLAAQPAVGQPNATPGSTASTPFQASANLTTQSSMYAASRPGPAQAATSPGTTANAAGAATRQTLLGVSQPPVNRYASQASLPSQAPNAGVQSGPVHLLNQPQATAGTIAMNEVQVGGPGRPVSNQSGGQSLLPQLQVPAGQLAQAASQTAGQGTAGFGETAGMPTMRSAAGGLQSQLPARPSNAPQFKTVSNVTGSGVTPAPADYPNLPLPDLNGGAPTATGVSKPEPQTIQVTPAQDAVVTEEATSQPSVQPPASDAFRPRGAGQQAVLAPKTDIAVNPAKEASVEIALPENAVEPNKQPSVDEEPALEGYCPVTLAREGRWADGKSEFAVRHRGRVYWLSSKEAMEEFLGNPDKTSPVVSGYDPLVLLEEGRLVEGSIEYGLHEEVSGTYLLFSSAESKQRYWDDFERYSKALTALMVKANQSGAK